MYPSPGEVQKYIEMVRPIWSSRERKILSAISGIVRLEWMEKEIKCYVVGSCVPFSDPLTMTVYKDKERFIDTLTHELIHQIEVQNADEPGYRTYRKFLADRYNGEPQITMNHILLFAVYMQLYSDLYGARGLARARKEFSGLNNPPYMRAWQVVRKEGYGNVIKDFLRVTSQHAAPSGAAERKKARQSAS